MDLFRSSYLFYLAHFMQLILLDLIAWALIYYSGYDNWFTYFLAAVLMATAQVALKKFFKLKKNLFRSYSTFCYNKKAQAGWLQHDFGHLAVFKTSKMNHFVQRIVICWFKVGFLKKNNIRFRQ